MNVYTPEQSSDIVTAIQAVLLGNNGYATVGRAPHVVSGLTAAGFIVINGTGYTQHALDCLRIDARNHAAARKPVSVDTGWNDFDYEGAILARQERMFPSF
jgi:hypothetical protein